MRDIAKSFLPVKDQLLAYIDSLERSSCQHRQPTATSCASLQSTATAVVSNMILPSSQTVIAPENTDSNTDPSPHGHHTVPTPTQTSHLLQQTHTSLPTQTNSSDTTSAGVVAAAVRLPHPQQKSAEILRAEKLLTMAKEIKAQETRADAVCTSTTAAASGRDTGDASGSHDYGRVANDDSGVRHVTSNDAFSASTIIAAASVPAPTVSTPAPSATIISALLVCDTEEPEQSMEQNLDAQKNDASDLFADIELTNRSLLDEDDDLRFEDFTDHVEESAAVNKPVKSNEESDIVTESYLDFSGPSGRLLSQTDITFQLWETTNGEVVPREAYKKKKRSVD